MSEQKAVCGGFLVGDGLKMEGKVLSAEGGSGGGVHYVECHGNDDFTTVECELTAEQVINLYKSGETIVLKLSTNGDTSNVSFLNLSNYSTSDLGKEFLDFCIIEILDDGLDGFTVSKLTVTIGSEGTISGHVDSKTFN